MLEGETPAAAEARKTIAVLEGLRKSGVGKSDALYQSLLRHLCAIMQKNEGEEADVGDFGANGSGRDGDQTVRAQMEAYRALARNVAVPVDVLKEVGTPKLLSGTPSLGFDQSVKSCDVEGVQSATAASRAQFFVAERQKRINAKVMYRIEELRMILPILDKESEEYRMAVNELRALGLLETQRKLRRYVSCEVRNQVSLACAVDARMFCRDGPFMASSSTQIVPVPPRHQPVQNDTLSSWRDTCRKQMLFNVMEQSKSMHDEKRERVLLWRKVFREVLARKYTKEWQTMREEELETTRRLLELRMNDRESFAREVEALKASRLEQLEERCKKVAARLAEISPDAVTATQPVTFLEKLKPYQLSGIGWLTSVYAHNSCGIFADECGLDKTAQIIASFCRISEYYHDFGPFLIISDADNIITAWEREINRLAPSYDVVVFKGDESECYEMLSETILPFCREHEGMADDNGSMRQRSQHFSRGLIVITKPERVLDLGAELSDIKWSSIVIDEGFTLDGRGPIVTKAVETVYRLEARSKIIMLNYIACGGNIFEDMWTMCFFLAGRDMIDIGCPMLNWLVPPLPHMLDEEFKDDDDDTIYGKLLTDEDQNKLHMMYSTILDSGLFVRHAQDVFNQISRREDITVRCKMSALQKAIYKEIFDKYIKLYEQQLSVLNTIHESKPKEENGTATEEMDTKILNENNRDFMYTMNIISLHPYLTYSQINLDRNIYRTSSKFDALCSLLFKLQNSPHNIVIMSRETHVVDLLEHFFAYRKQTYVRIDGQEPSMNTVQMWEAGSVNQTCRYLLTSVDGDALRYFRGIDTVIVLDAESYAIIPEEVVPEHIVLKVFKLVTCGALEEFIISDMFPLTNPRDAEQLRNMSMFYRMQNAQLECNLVSMHMRKLLDLFPDSMEQYPQVEEVQERLDMVRRFSEYFELVTNAPDEFDAVRPLAIPNALLNYRVARNEDELFNLNRLDLQYPGEGLLTDEELGQMDFDSMQHSISQIPGDSAGDMFAEGLKYQHLGKMVMADSRKKRPDRKRPVKSEKVPKPRKLTDRQSKRLSAFMSDPAFSSAFEPPRQFPPEQGSSALNLLIPPAISTERNSSADDMQRMKDSKVGRKAGAKKKALTPMVVTKRCRKIVDTIIDHINHPEQSMFRISDGNDGVLENGHIVKNQKIMSFSSLQKREVEAIFAPYESYGQDFFYVATLGEEIRPKLTVKLDDEKAESEHHHKKSKSHDKPRKKRFPLVSLKSIKKKDYAAEEAFAVDFISLLRLKSFFVRRELVAETAKMREAMGLPPDEYAPSFEINPDDTPEQRKIKEDFSDILIVLELFCALYSQKFAKEPPELAANFEQILQNSKSRTDLVVDKLDRGRSSKRGTSRKHAAKRQLSETVDERSEAMKMLILPSATKKAKTSKTPKSKTGEKKNMDISKMFMSVAPPAPMKIEEEIEEMEGGQVPMVLDGGAAMYPIPPTAPGVVPAEDDIDDVEDEDIEEEEEDDDDDDKQMFNENGMPIFKHDEE